MTFIIIRLRSLGNVAMTVPVISSLSKLNPQHNFVLVTEKDASYFFEGLPNVVCHRSDLFNNGIRNLKQLLFSLLSYHPDVVIDWQDNPETKLLRLLFLFKGIKAYSIRYGKLEKRHLCIWGYKRCGQLLSEFERYAETCKRAGLKVDDSFESIPYNAPAARIITRNYGDKQGQWIGIAPFAKFQSNQLSYRVIKEVISTLSRRPNTHIFLFGGGVIEEEVLREWEGLYDNVRSVVGKYAMACELELMRMLDLMICMDSANQHLARLTGTRVITIWCATHVYSGYACWKQDPADNISVPDLTCRPCTTNGTNECRFNNFSCKEITADDILEKIENVLPMKIN